MTAAETHKKQSDEEEGFTDEDCCLKSDDREESRIFADPRNSWEKKHVNVNMLLNEKEKRRRLSKLYLG